MSQKAVTWAIILLISQISEIWMYAVSLAYIVNIKNEHCKKDVDVLIWLWLIWSCFLDLLDHIFFIFDAVYLFQWSRNCSRTVWSGVIKFAQMLIGSGISRLTQKLAMSLSSWAMNLYNSVLNCNSKIKRTTRHKNHFMFHIFHLEKEFRIFFHIIQQILKEEYVKISCETVD